MTDTPTDEENKNKALENLKEIRDVITQTREIADRVLNLVESVLKNLEE